MEQGDGGRDLNIGIESNLEIGAKPEDIKPISCKWVYKVMICPNEKWKGTKLV